ncbi:hypothetical protein AOLI_G00248920 [Acnodon oligacanthus]
MAVERKHKLALAPSHGSVLWPVSSKYGQKHSIREKMAPKRTAVAHSITAPSCGGMAKPQTFNSNSGQLKSDRRALLSEGCGVFLPFDQKDTFPAKSSCELASITAEKCLAYNEPFILAYLPITSCHVQIH